MTGLDLAKRMMRIRPDIPIILWTGLKNRSLEEKAKETGVCASLMKPLELSGTAEVIRKVLDTEGN